MVKQQLEELIVKNQDRKLKSNERNKKWYAKARNEIENDDKNADDELNEIEKEIIAANY